MIIDDIYPARFHSQPAAETLVEPSKNPETSIRLNTRRDNAEGAPNPGYQPDIGLFVAVALILTCKYTAVEPQVSKQALLTIQPVLLALPWPTYEITYPRSGSSYRSWPCLQRAGPSHTE